LPRLLIKLRLARLISPRFEFALALLDSSRADQQSEDFGMRNSDCGLKKSNGSSLSIRIPHSEIRNPMPALLFKGCVTEGPFARVNRATVRVLEVNGCAVRAPDNQVCCGALHAHAGDLDGARGLARRNIDAFNDEIAAHIITNAGGCGALLVSYAHLLADDAEYAERAREFSQRVRDISQQLEATGICQGASLDENVATYDASCHLLYGQRASDAPLEMLRAIPGLRFVPLTGSETCCGGAG